MAMWLQNENSEFHLKYGVADNKFGARDRARRMLQQYYGATYTRRRSPTIASATSI